MIDEIHLAETLTADMMPIVKVLVAGMVAMWVKDFISSASKGIAFYMNSAFGEGDKVKIDDADAIIVKIGLRQTVFSIIKDDGDYVWRYVPNEMISLLKLEKVIYDADSKENRQKIDENKGSILANAENLTNHIKEDDKKTKTSTSSRYEHP